MSFLTIGRCLLHKQGPTKQIVLNSEEDVKKIKPLAMSLIGLQAFDLIAVITTLVIATLGATAKLHLPPAATYSLFAAGGLIIAGYIISFVAENSVKKNFDQ